MSKRHCQLVYDTGEGEWELHDLSANGTFVNHASEPLGRGATQKLRHGDRIKFGQYEIEVTIDEDEAVAERDGGRIGLRSADFVIDEPAQPRPGYSPFNDDRLPGPGSMSEPSPGAILDPSNSPILPPDFDPLAPNAEPFQGPTQPDHAPVLDSAFRPPPASAAIIPDDWDVDLAGAARPPRLGQAPQPSQRPQPKVQEERAPTPLRQERSPVTQQVPRDESLAAAFLRGVGVSETTLPDPEKAFERIGAATRATVAGLRQTLRARAQIKDEFRIEQTMVQASGNNPLKFSVDDDDALATLLGTGRRGSMPAEEAIKEAFNDLRLHELATISAMQAAVRVLLAQFAPEAIESKVGSGALDIYPAQKKARAWEAFAALHKNVTQALSDDFDSVFGKAFARAYEQAIHKLENDETPS